MKKLGGFLQMDVPVKVDWDGHFCGFAGATPISTLPETT